MNAAEILVVIMKILFSKGYPNYSQLDYTPSYEKGVSDDTQRSAFDYAVLDYYGEGRRENENFEADYAINPQDYGHTHFDYSLINMHSKDYLNNFDDDQPFALDIQNQDYADVDLDEDLKAQAGVNDHSDTDYADENLDVDDNLKAQAGVIFNNDDVDAEMDYADEFSDNLKAQAGVSLEVNAEMGRNPREYDHANFDYSLITMHSKDYLHNFDDDHLFAIDIQKEDYADEYLEKDFQTQSGVNDDLDIDYADKDVDDNLKAQAGVILSNDDAGAEMESDDEFLEENLKAQAGVSS